MKTDLINLFNKTIKEFADDISLVFPEIDMKIYQVIDLESTEYIEHFIEVTKEHAALISQKSEKVLELEECVILPNIDLVKILKADGISVQTIDTVWKYVHTLMLLSSTFNASTDDLEKTIEEWTSMLENENGEHSADFLESIKQQAETMFNLLGQFNEDEDVNMFADLDDDDGPSMNPADFFAKAAAAGSSGENDDDDEEEDDDDEDDEEDAFQKIQNSKVGKLAQELASEVKLEDFIDNPGQSKDPKQAFKNFLGKDPKKLMGLVKKVSDKVKSKLASGEINEPELVEEVQDMVSSLQKSKKFKKACRRTGMGDLFEKAMNGKQGDMDPAQMEQMMKAMMANKRPMKTPVKDRLQQKIQERKMLQFPEQVPKTDGKYNDMSIDEIAAEIEGEAKNTVAPKTNKKKKKGHKKDIVAST